MADDNLVRAVADVVSVEGWSLEDGDGLAIHVDVSFRTAAVGGAHHDQVQFRLSLRRAELVAVSSAVEGIAIMPQTVSRDRVKKELALRRTAQVTGKKSVRGNAEFAVTPFGILPSFGSSWKSQRDQRSNISVSETAEVANLVVQHRKASDGSHRWEMLPGYGKVLEGAGWDANSSPRFKVERPPVGKIRRCLIFQVRCLREDLVMEDIQIIPSDGLPRPLFRPDEQTKFAAAEAFLKAKLLEHGLISGDLSNRFAEICLLETVVEL